MQPQLSDGENVEAEAPVAREKQAHRPRLHFGQLVDRVRVELGVEDLGAELRTLHLQLEGLRYFEVPFEQHQLALGHMIPAFLDRGCDQLFVDGPQACEVFLFGAFRPAHVGSDGELEGFLHVLTHKSLFCQAVHPGFSMRDTNHVAGAFAAVICLEVD